MLIPILLTIILYGVSMFGVHWLFKNLKKYQKIPNGMEIALYIAITCTVILTHLLTHAAR